MGREKRYEDLEEILFKYLGERKNAKLITNYIENVQFTKKDLEGSMLTAAIIDKAMVWEYFNNLVYKEKIFKHQDKISEMNKKLQEALDDFEKYVSLRQKDVLQPIT